MSNTAWLAVALAVTFLAIGGYTIGLVVRKRALETRLSELEAGRKSEV